MPARTTTLPLSTCSDVLTFDTVSAVYAARPQPGDDPLACNNDADAAAGQRCSTIEYDVVQGEAVFIPLGGSLVSNKTAARRHVVTPGTTEGDGVIVVDDIGSSGAPTPVAAPTPAGTPTPILKSHFWDWCRTIVR